MTLPIALLVLNFLVIALCVFYVRKINQAAKLKLGKYNELIIEKVRLSERVCLLNDLEEKYEKLLCEYNNACARIAELEATLKSERESINDKITLLQKAECLMSDKFSSLSADALAKNNQSFLELAKTSFENLHNAAKVQLENKTKEISDITTPIKNALSDVEEKLQKIDNERTFICQSIGEQINSLIVSQDKLKLETSKLSSALKVPNIRGRWGEMQLKRVVELAGMTKHCDFHEQMLLSGDHEDLRPDMIINIPGRRTIIVDAKTPLSAYMSALETDNEDEKNKLLKNHAKQVKAHCALLGNKNYFNKCKNSPEFVVMFIPGDVFFSTAMEYDPTLIEYAIEHNVIISTPTTLLALLHAIAFGWQNEIFTENAKQIISLGKDLQETLKATDEYLSELEKNITNLNTVYSKFSNFIDDKSRNILVQFKTLGLEAKN